MRTSARSRSVRFLIGATRSWRPISNSTICRMRRCFDKEIDTDCTEFHGIHMPELLHHDETHQLIGFCMEIHRELGKGHDEVIYKDALVVELSRAGIPFVREKNYEITYKGVILPHY